MLCSLLQGGTKAEAHPGADSKEVEKNLKVRSVLHVALL